MGHWSIVVPDATINKTLNPSAEAAGNYAARATATNLILNPHFAIPGGGGADVFANWVEVWSDGAVADVGQTLQLTAGPGLNTVTSETFAVAPGNTYFYSFLSAGDGIHDGRYFIIDVTHGTVILATTPTGITGVGFGAVSGSFVAPAACVSALIAFACPSTNGGIAYFDDVIVSEMALVTRSTAYSYRGRYSYRVQANIADTGIELTLSSLANAVHYVTMMVRGTLPSPWQWSLDNATWTAPTLIESHGNWSLYGASFPAAEANGSTTLRIRQTDTDAADYYIDAIQVEEKSYWTTYCDGEQPGCIWSGAVHGSTSSRTAQRREGGRVRDLEDVFDITVLTKQGYGLPDVKHNTVDQSLLPGALLQSTKTQARVLILTALAESTTMGGLHSIRKDLIDILKHDAVTPLQPVRLRYTGAGTPVELAAYYDTGLGGEVILANSEQLAIRLIAYDPFFSELGETAVTLDEQDTLAVTRVIAKIGGQWSALGAPAGTAVGGLCRVEAIAFGPDGTVYVAGVFLNWDGAASSDYIAKWSGAAWSALSTGADGAIYAMVVGPDGTLYVGGSFANIGGVAAARIAKWDGSAWSALGAGMDSYVAALAIGPDGYLYAGGDFTTAGGGAAKKIAKWSGAAWSALGTGFDHAGDWVSGLAFTSDGTLYATGNILSSGATTLNHVAKWTGSAWVALGTGLEVAGQGSAIVAAPDDTLYVGGNFTVAGGVTVGYIAHWTGAAWEDMAGGVNDEILPNGLSWGLDGLLYVTGIFTLAGGTLTVDRAARWNGSAWLPMDIDLPGTPRAHVAQRSNGDLWIGTDTTGNAIVSGLTTVTNGGSVTVYPGIIVSRSGGTSATLISIANVTTGDEMLFNYALLNGETLTIDLTPGAKKITSSFFGNVIGRTLLPGSDLATFGLQPGANTIACLVSEAGTPTVVAYMLFIARHWSADGVAV